MLTKDSTLQDVLLFMQAHGVKKIALSYAMPYSVVVFSEVRRGPLAFMEAKTEAKGPSALQVVLEVLNSLPKKNTV